MIDRKIKESKGLRRFCSELLKPWYHFYLDITDSIFCMNEDYSNNIEEDCFYLKIQFLYMYFYIIDSQCTV